MEKVLTKLNQSSAIDEGNTHYVIEQGLFKLAENNIAEKAYYWVKDNQNACYTAEAEYPKRNNTSKRTIPLKCLPDACFNCLEQGFSIEHCFEKNLTIYNHQAPICTLLQLSSIVSVPIIIQDEVHGFISLANKEQTLHNHQRIISLLKTIAKLCGRAILAKKLKTKQQALVTHKQLLDEIETVASVGGWVFDLTKKKLSWTKETYKIYAVSSTQPITPDFGIKFYTPEVRLTISNAFNKAVLQGKPYELELPLIDAKGQSKWVRTTGKPNIIDGVITHIYGAFEDITHTKQLLDDQKESKTNLKKILDNLNDAIVTISDRGIILSVNSVITKLFGYKQSEVIGQNITILMPEPFASNHNKYMEKYLLTGEAQIIGIGRELPAKRKNGSLFSIELSISEVLKGNKKVFIGIIKDITDRKNAEQHIKKLAYFDHLTDTLNRHSFEQEVQKFNANINNNLTFLLLNIDNFSQLNLIYGEVVGDEILKYIANRIKNEIPLWATVYRSDADNFFLILDNNQKQHHSSLQTTDDITQQLQRTINQPYLINNKHINIKVSISLLESTSTHLTDVEIIPLLEIALRKAKKQGGNCIVKAEQHETNQLKRYSELNLAMHSASFIDELSIMIQPQCDVKGRMFGSEILLRWYSPLYGWVSPAEFISLAEDNGKIIEIGEWVIEQACQLIHDKRLLLENAPAISVNISAKQISQPHFIKHLLSTLKQFNVPPSSLILELTESVLVADFNLINEKMTYLKNKGINFSLDDFGTGYSSLSYIQNLPISELKIDKSFIDEIHTEHDNVPMVNMIIQMANALNLNIIAEGVEFHHQLTYLKDKGCKLIQGYLFSKPLDKQTWLNHSIYYSST